MPITIKSATNEIFNSHKFRLLAIDEGEGITLGVPLDGFRIYTCRIENDFSPTPAMAPPTEQVFLQIRRFSIEIDGERLELGLPVQVLQQLGGLDQTASLSQPINDDGNPAEGLFLSSIHGTIKAWIVEDNALVNKGRRVAVMEAMTIETNIAAEIGGKLEIIKKTGNVVNVGEVIVRILPLQRMTGTISFAIFVWLFS